MWRYVVLFGASSVTEAFHEHVYSCIQRKTTSNRKTSSCVFKEWLKRSLIKQREDQIQKRVVRHERARLEDEKAKKAALRRVEAKIAYRDWK